MKYVQHASREIKSYLSKHISLTNLRLSAFVLSLLSCIVTGSILLFTLYTPTFHHIIGLTYFQINFIASISLGAMYLCLPVLGYLSDCYGPSILSFLSMWLFVPSYALNSWLLSWNCSSVPLFSMTFGMIGLATSSLYFSSLLTCAKIFPHQKGLAISLPVTCYGLSALLGSQVLKMDYFHLSRETYKSGDDRSDLLNLVRVFKFFAVLYSVVGISSFISSSVAIVEQDAIFGEIEDIMSSNNSIPPSSAANGTSEEQDENAPLLRGEDLAPQRSLDPPNHKKRYINFLKDVSAWLLLVSLILNVGPLESYQNNLSSILSFINTASSPVSNNNNNKNIGTGSDVSDKVSLLATASTLSRLVLGVLCDFFQQKQIDILWLLVAVIILGIVGQWFNNIVLNGVAYGGLFTTYPTVVASVWGIDLLGSTWGSFMVAPAIGSIMYSLLYGLVADSNKDNIAMYFKVTAFSLSISCILVLVAFRVWRKRGQLFS
ncbi:uncharacterized protein LODBEIA_P32420 [Lodderomyces beijingensis]|uniref:Probable transporter MCH1 n=1 Tax=Lodderomyces beijingensis TaxID=1775926 RepID=A0ABP0ZMX0_9ASCO